MTTRPPAAMRRAVTKRAGDRCEYCLIPQAYSASTHQVDHVIAEKHGGDTSLDNLALSCAVCNRRKASDISSNDPQTGELARLFNPRTQSWSDHFRLENGRFIGLTAEGRTTVEFFKLNAYDRVVEREDLLEAGVSFEVDDRIRKERDAEN